MELELVPLVLAALVGLAGLALVADGWLADAAPRVAERRRQARTERHRGGEIAVGVGLLCAAAALAGRDSWRWGTVAVVAAAVCVVVGAALNGRYLREQLTNRGAARRGRAGERRLIGADAPRDPDGRPLDPPRRPHDRRLADRRGTSDVGPPAA